MSDPKTAASSFSILSSHPDGCVRECRFPDVCRGGSSCNCPRYSSGEWAILNELRAIRKLMERDSA